MQVEDLIPEVITAMKTSQQIRTAVYAELDDGEVHLFPVVNSIGEVRLKAHLLFLAGRTAGRKHRAIDVVETCMISPVQIIQESRHSTRGERLPAWEPQMEGARFAVVRNAAPYHTLVKLYQIKHDKTGRATEFIHLGDEVNSQALMPLAFLVGWHSRALSDAEVQAKQPQGMRAFLE